MRLSALILISILFSSRLTFAAPGVVVLGGGGPEGDIGVITDWSYPLYSELIKNGDTNGDKKIKVVVLSLDRPSSNFMVDYLKSMGATSSHNLVVKSRKDANDPKTVAMLQDADVVFFRGGNQGKAYQLWKGSKLHGEIKKLSDRGGAIGGTSAGAMELSEYSITGGRDFDTKEVLGNGHSPLLNDQKKLKKSGINNDFFNSVPGIIVDTHCGERGRVGRLMAVMAKTTDDYNDKKIAGICLEERTGVVIKDGKAKVYGIGAVHFLTETSETKKVRAPGRPLSYLNVRNDALTEGWSFNLKTNLPDLKSAPKNTNLIFPKIGCAEIYDQLSVKGKKDKGISFSKPFLSKNLSIAVDAYSDETVIMSRDQKKGAIQTLAYDEMARNPNNNIVMLDATSELRGLGDNTITVHAQKKGIGIPSLIMDCKHCTHTSKAKSGVVLNQQGQEVQSTALINLRLHVIGPGDTYNLQTHKATLAKELAKDYLNEADCKFDSLVQKELEELSKDSLNIVRKLDCL